VLLLRKRRICSKKYWIFGWSSRKHWTWRRRLGWINGSYWLRISKKWKRRFKIAFLCLRW